MVTAVGVCDDEGCEEETITFIDPEGAEDTAHSSDFEKV